MTAVFIIAIFIVPYLAELCAKSLPNKDKRPLVHYLLVPVMGCVVYGSFAALAGHAYLALAGSILLYASITTLSNMKINVLHMPLNAHDFMNARNIVIYPEFYIAYVGWPVLICAVSLFLMMIVAAFALEPWFAVYGFFPFQYGGWAAGLLFWYGLMRLLALLVTQVFNEETRARYGMTTDTNKDVAHFGLFPSILLQQILLMERIDKKALRDRPLNATINTEKPADIISIQGESYFDLDRLFDLLPDAEKRNWQALRALEAAGVVTGQITVPCWGAYTMQTEFSFLSQLENSVLGIDRVDPYIRFAQKPVSTIAAALRSAGYRTLCIHPAKKGFFRRDEAMDNMGFDEFIGIEAFDKASYFGKYISDDALADKIETLITQHHQTSSQPLFVFVITIESHGPWADGRLDAFLPETVSQESLTAENATKDREFALYQVHMENLMAFYRRLSVDAELKNRRRVVSLYGDHMPAFGPLFAKHGFNDERVDYLLWNSAQPATPCGDQQIETFAATVLKEANIELS